MCRSCRLHFELAYLVDEDTELAQSGTRVARVRDVGHGGVRCGSFSLDAESLVAANMHASAVSVVTSARQAYLFVMVLLIMLIPDTTTLLEIDPYSWRQSTEDGMHEDGYVRSRYHVRQSTCSSGT